MEMLPDVFTTGDLLLSFGLFTSGVILNWLHKCWTLNINLKSYWIEYGNRSITTVVTCVIAYFGLIGTEVLNPVTYFMTGYMCDSLINKPPVVSTSTRK